MVNKRSSAVASGTQRRVSEPLALILVGGLVATIAWLWASVAWGSWFGDVIAVVGGSVGATFWLVGVIALGLRIGSE